MIVFFQKFAAKSQNCWLKIKILIFRENLPKFRKICHIFPFKFSLFSRTVKNQKISDQIFRSNFRIAWIKFLPFQTGFQHYWHIQTIPYHDLFDTSTITMRSLIICSSTCPRTICRILLHLKPPIVVLHQREALPILMHLQPPIVVQQQEALPLVISSPTNFQRTWSVWIVGMMMVNRSLSQSSFLLKTPVDGRMHLVTKKKTIHGKSC